jgi:uncharacterized protein
MSATCDWDLVREPEPLRAGGTLIFPDFAIVHRRDPRLSWLLEIVGFWTADYLDKKLDFLRRAHVDRLILCIDEERDCGEGALPQQAQVIRYRRRIDVSRVLQVLEGDSSPSRMARQKGEGRAETMPVALTIPTSPARPLKAPGRA